MKNINKVALITGAAHRLGKSIAMELHQKEIDIAIHCSQSIPAANLLKDKLNQIRPQSAQVFPCDLIESTNAALLIEQINNQFGRLDYLVNNASIFYPTPIEQYQDLQLEAFLQINFFQPVKLAQAAFPLLKKEVGSIVNLIDIYAQAGLENHTSYVASKTGLLEATKSLAVELSPEVRVNGVSPGAILWPDLNDSSDDCHQQKIIENTALKRRGSPQDISKTVAYLLTEASYSTGSVINVDGGRRLYI